MQAQIAGNRLDVQTVIERRRFTNNQNPLGEDHRVWAFFNNHHYASLNALIQDPLHFNPADGEHANAFVRAPGFDALPRRPTRATAAPQQMNTTTYYVRVLRYERAAQLRTSIQHYEEQYPADREWVEYLRQELGQAENRGHGPFFLHYFGVTLTGTADTRLEEDLDSAQHTRFINWTQTAAGARQWLAYHITGLQNLQFADVAQFRASDVAGVIEDIWIKAAGNSVINSANGGFGYDWNPPEQDITTWNQARIQHPIRELNVYNEPGFMMQHELNQHFIDHADYLWRVPDTQIDMKPSDELVVNITRSALPHNVFQGQALSLIVGYDIPRFAFMDGRGFYDDGNASATVLFFEQVDDLVRHQIHNDQQARGRRAFIDMHPMDLRRHAKFAIPFLTRYLRLTRPIVVLGMGQHVYTAFACDILFQPWRQDALLLARINQFLNNIVSPAEVGDLEELLDLPTIATRSAIETFAQRIGNPSIVQYGPDDGDICIFVPFRHPGNLRYDPAIQHEQAREIFLTFCCAEILDDIVQRRLEQGNGRPMAANDLEEWLLEIIAEYEEAIAVNGENGQSLQGLLQATKDAIAAYQATTQSERLLAAAHIRNVQFPGARGTRTRREFEGARNSVIRGQQLDILLETDLQRRRRRSQVSVLPCPHNIHDVHSDEYRAWFMSRAEGIDMQYSANASGHSPFAGLTREQIADILRERGFGPFAERRVASANVNVPVKQEAILQLIEFDTWSQIQDARLTRKATCTFCNDEFLHDAHNTFHRCPQNDGQAIHSQPQGLRFNRILYAHDIIDDMAFDITPELLAEMELRPLDAVEVLNEHNRNQWDLQVGELGPIYIPDNGERNREWEFQQAMDKAIIASGLGEIRIPNDMLSDNWLYDGAVTKRYIVRHITTVPLRRGPFVAVGCGVDDFDDRCRYLSVVHPTRTERIRQPGPQGYAEGYFHPRTRRHTHKAQGGKACTFSDQEAINFWQLPLAAKRYLWMNFIKNPHEHHDEDPTLWAVDQEL